MVHEQCHWVVVHIYCFCTYCTMPTEVWICIQAACNTEDCTMPTEVWICIQPACNTEDCTMPTEVHTVVVIAKFMQSNVTNETKFTLLQAATVMLYWGTCTMS